MCATFFVAKGNFLDFWVKSIKRRVNTAKNIIYEVKNLKNLNFYSKKILWRDLKRVNHLILNNWFWHYLFLWTKLINEILISLQLFLYEIEIVKILLVSITYNPLAESIRFLFIVNVVKTVIHYRIRWFTPSIKYSRCKIFKNSILYIFYRR